MDTGKLVDAYKESTEQFSISQYLKMGEELDDKDDMGDNVSGGLSTDYRQNDLSKLLTHFKTPKYSPEISDMILIGGLVSRLDKMYKAKAFV